MCSFKKFPTFFCVSLDTAESIMVSSTANVSLLLVRLETGSESCKLPTKCSQLYRLKYRGQLRQLILVLFVNECILLTSL